MGRGARQSQCRTTGASRRGIRRGSRRCRGRAAPDLGTADLRELPWPRGQAGASGTQGARGSLSRRQGRRLQRGRDPRLVLGGDPEEAAAVTGRLAARHPDPFLRGTQAWFAI